MYVLYYWIGGVSMTDDGTEEARAGGVQVAEVETASKALRVAARARRRGDARYGDAFGLGVVRIYETATGRTLAPHVLAQRFSVRGITGSVAREPAAA